MKHITVDELKRIDVTEGLVLQGCGGDPQEWFDGINEMLTEAGILLDGDTFKKTFIFEHNDLINILFSMDDVKLNIGKLALWRLQNHDSFGGTWLSDYLQNQLGVVEGEFEADRVNTKVEVIKPKENGLLIEPAATPLMMIPETDLAALLFAMHSVGGEYMRDTQRNLSVLASGGEAFFVMVTADSLTVTPADFVYRRDMEEYQAWMLADATPDVSTFMLTVTNREDGRIIGNLYETDLWSVKDDLRENSFHFLHLDAEMRDGTRHRFTLDEWDAMELIERDQVVSWVKSYDPADEERLAVHLSGLPAAYEESWRPLTMVEFLPLINAQYMAQAMNAQPDMIRVALEAAKEILAQDAAPVFRLRHNGAERLSPIQAIKTDLWYLVDREFAVKRCDGAGIEKWAERAAGEMLQKMERGEQRKSRGAEIY